MIMHKSKKDPELFHYFNAKNEKLWCYRHRYYDSLGKRKEKQQRGFKTEKEAYRKLLDIKSTTLNGHTKQVDHSNITVAEWLDIWFETHENEWKISTRKQRENAIKHQMKPLLGKYKLAELDKTTYKRVYVNKLLQKYKSSTVSLFHRLFKIAVNAAVDDEILARNRFNKIVIESSEEKTDNFLTSEELSSFLSAAKSLENITNFTIIYLLAFTGLRRGEAFGLKWEDIDFTENKLTVRRTRDEKGARSPKTKRSHRSILIDSSLVNELKRYSAWCKKTKLSYGMTVKESDYVFISYQNGTPSGSNTIKYCFDRICEKANVKRITPHSLRHTHATILIAQRIPVKTIADRLGNTPNMIYDVYGHSFDRLEQETVAAFNDSLKEAGGAFGGGS